MVEPPPEPDPPLPNTKSKQNISDELRLEALTMLVMLSEEGKIRHGGIKMVSEKMGLPRSLLKRLWKKSPDTRASGRVCIADYVSRKKKNSRPAVYNTQEFAEQLKSIPLSNRKTIRSVAAHLGIAPSTFFWWVKRDRFFRKHNSALKPSLSEEHKVARVMYVLDEVSALGRVSARGGNGGNVRKYKDMYDRIHVDEKWFYMCRDQQGYYMAV
jgi:transposase-like protein